MPSPKRSSKRNSSRKAPPPPAPASALDAFLPPVERWFRENLGEPTRAQTMAWPAIREGEHALILSPTGSGKTLAAFLACLDDLWRTLERGDEPEGVHTLYVSPLKALNADVHRNLEEPLAGVRRVAEEMGGELPEIRAAVRTGDTTQAARQAMVRKPPHVLITTPESLYILLTSEKGRKGLASVKYVIVDEIHAVAGTKRGVHLALTLERLAHHAGEFQRIGLSATQRPLEEVARFLGGAQVVGGKVQPRDVKILDAGQRKVLDLAVVTAAPDFTDLQEGSVWPAVIERLHDLVKQHTSTLVFANNRRLSERIAAQLNRLMESGAERPDRVIATMDPGSDATLAKAARAADATDGKRGKGDKKKSRRRDDEDEALTASGKGPVRAHHGSMSKEARRAMEEDLKHGRLPALVATSSLELGIDVGSVDLVVLLQAPKGVSRGLQRVGRAGHQVGRTSKGRIFATHREDLVECAVTVRAMLAGEVEETRVPKGCLDVLAQQVAAAVAADPWSEDDLYALLRGAYPYWELSRALFDETLEMLGGKYPAQAFRELKARIHRDRARGLLTALPGTRSLVLMNAGAIPDRGYYACVHVNGSTKLGDLDEEFVFESRVGDVFLLGSSAWRIVAIDQDRVMVQEAPGEPARMPFWRGEAFSRPYDLGVRISRFRGECEPLLDDDEALAKLLSETYALDEPSARTISTYFRRQRDATGVLPTDRRVVVEVFRDEIGDPRLAVLSAFGGRVNGPWALALRHKLNERLGIEVEAHYNDDGILIRFPDAEGFDAPFDLVRDLSAEEAERIVLDELASSALFAAQFRQNAERALLLPRARGGKRTPFWLQRMRAADLLQVARRFDGFPIILETYRDVVRDVLDLEHVKELLSSIQSGEIEVVSCETDTPSPFVASLLFDFVGVHMYEWDKPKGEHKTQMLRLNRELLEEVLGKGSLRELLREEAIEEVEDSLQSLGHDGRARNEDETAALLQRLGALSVHEVARRHAGESSGASAAATAADLARLEDQGRVLQVPLRRGGGLIEWRYAAVEDAMLLKRAHADDSALAGAGAGSARTLLKLVRERGAAGLAEDALRDAPVAPERLAAAVDALLRGWLVTRRGSEDEPRYVAFDDAVPEALHDLGDAGKDRDSAAREIIHRHLRARGPVSLADVEDATALPADLALPALDALEAAKEVAVGEFRPGGAGREWVERGNLARIHRRTLAILRREVQPVDLEAYQDFLLRHTHLHPRTRRQGRSGVLATLRDLHGAAAPGEVWERSVLWGRLRGYSAEDVGAIIAGGDVLFAGTGEKGRFRVLVRGEGRAFVKDEPAPDLGDLATRILEKLRGEGALFSRDLSVLLQEDMETIARGLDTLVRAGEVTNESFDVMRRVLRGERLATRDKGRRGLASEVPNPWGAPLPRPRLGGFPTRTLSGRWSLVKTSSVLGAPEPRPLLAERLGVTLLHRYGILTRELFARESTAFSWREVSDALKHLEVRGEIRRGYFVNGLQGLQFALPDVVEALRERQIARRAQEKGAAAEYVPVNVTDPACVFGTGTEHAIRDRWNQDVRLSRLASTILVLADGRPVLLSEAHGRKLTSLEGSDDHDLRQAVRALAQVMDQPSTMRPRRALVIETLDGKPVVHGLVNEILEEAGFMEESRRMVLYPSRRHR